MKTFCFTVDDNIRFLQALSAGKERSLFDHPYLAMYKRLHEKYGLKIQLNLFHEMPGFDLSQTTDRFRQEWASNAHWLKLSFHSRLENREPYRDSGYQEVYEDCAAVHREILRFAGEKSLAQTTTIHYCQTTSEGLRALGDHGMRGLLGLFGNPQQPRSSYSLSEKECAILRTGAPVCQHGVSFYSIDLIINLYPKDELFDRLQALAGRKDLRVMIHEQYFYPDYPKYQPDFEEKLDLVFSFLKENGYESSFAEELEG